MTPGRPDRSSGSDLRERLIEAALEILQEPDTPLDLRKVAERAGKSRTAPYLVFGKESEGGGLLALRIAVAAEGARQMTARMEEAARGIDDPIDALRLVALAFLDFVEEQGRLFRLMYGPDISAVQRVGTEGFRDHPEFRALLDFRGRAGGVISELIHRAQERALLRPEPGDRQDDGSSARRVDGSGARRVDEPNEPGGVLDTPRARYLQIAWASMIGVALLRDDQLLQAVGWRITPEQGARLIVESVFGLDPQRVADAAASFLASESVDGRGGEERRGEGDAELDDADDRELDELVVREDVSPMRAAPMEVSAREAPPFETSLRQASFERASPMDLSSDDDAEPRFASAAPSPPAPSGPVHRSRPASSPRSEVSLTETLNRNSGLRRAAFSDKIRNRARILWIDDHPEWIEHEVDTLRQLGAEVRVVRNTHGAVRALEGDGGAAPFQVILSDIARGSRRDAGIRALPELRRLAPGVPVVFFVADYDPDLGVPKGAAGITNRADELLHLVVDALEGR